MFRLQIVPYHQDVRQLQAHFFSLGPDFSLGKDNCQACRFGLNPLTLFIFICRISFTMSAEDLRGRPHGDPKEAIDAVASPYEVLEIQTPPFHSKFSMDFGEHRIIGPDGREEVRLVTTFPQMATMTFPYTEDGFVLIEEDTYVAGPKLEAPGGVIKLDDPQEAALMIVKGETGIEFVPDSITEAVRYQTSAANTDNKTFLSSGLVARIGEQDPE